jgi:3-phenylpropionate/cinnamic acid dioxygenase small subunit
MNGSGATGAVRADVADVLVRYATGIDRRDWPLFRTVFTDDCEADYGAIGHWHGVDEITDWMARAHAGCGHTLHRITNIAVERGDDGQVHARCYVDAIILGADNREGVRAIGYYDDDLTSTDDGWRIARRRFTAVHLQTVDAPLTA